jgi:hypothetical protein
MWMPLSYKFYFSILENKEQKKSKFQISINIVHQKSSYMYISWKIKTFITQHGKEAFLEDKDMDYIWSLANCVLLNFQTNDKLTWDDTKPKKLSFPLSRCGATFFLL